VLVLLNLFKNSRLCVIIAIFRLVKLGDPEMKLRTILLTLSILAFLSATIGGYLYYASLKESTFREANRQAATRAEVIRKNLASFLSENIKPVKIMSGMRVLQLVLNQKDADSLSKANEILDFFNKGLEVDVCYLMNREGETIASSNRNALDSFVGKNFSFRPYFQNAIQGTPWTYLALGTTSGKRGAYYSHPVYSSDGDTLLGVAVIKASIEQIEKELSTTKDEIVLVTDSHGVVFISNEKKWLYHLFNKPTSEDISSIAASLQFGEGPWNWIGIHITEDNHATDPSGNNYLMHSLQLYNYPNWTVIHLYNLNAISNMVSQTLAKMTGPIVLSLSFLVGLTVFLLYRKASNEIVKRKMFQNALRKNEERFRSIYHNTPAMLHSIDTEGKLISVSDHWTEVLGYKREEVIGEKLTNYFTNSSRIHAESEVFPEFFKTGFCKDIPYQFIKKDGQKMDILLSAIGDRDDKGNIIRSLAVSIDVTDRKKAEKALNDAKEELSRYSKTLELQVEERTKEITNILTQLRHLSGNIMTNQEKERSAIARELHDELGQILTALRMDSVWLQDRLKSIDEKGSDRAAAMCDLIDQTIDDVRSMAIRLRPGVLDDLGLLEALEWYTSDFERRTGITCIFEHINVPLIKDNVATAAYRITQEALTNVARHAKANHIVVDLRTKDDQLVLSVSDNGKGFDISGISESKALGVAGMRERASLVGGTLDVQSWLNTGTQIIFSCPSTHPRHLGYSTPNKTRPR